ncbi:MAG: hypothetical protein IKU42_07595 [Oscillospiraceae bacterium]|nr:hypothetical protein [Oscillospiraceae bacterium]
MKKMLAVILGLMLILLSATGCARPDPTYVDPEDFDVEFYPVSVEGKTFASGLTAIQIVMNTPNVELGAGEIRIFNASTGERIARYDARMDTDYIYINSGTNPAYAQLIIFLPEGQYFEAGESYYVTMDEKFIYVDDIKDFVGEVKEGEWEFTVAEFGYDGNITEMPTIYLVGDTIEIPVALADEATLAVLNYDNVAVVSAEQRALFENGTFTLEAIQAGTTAISVMFIDENGNHIETLAFTVTIK